jgi:hypothetical protein
MKEANDEEGSCLRRYARLGKKGRGVDGGPVGLVMHPPHIAVGNMSREKRLRQGPGYVRELRASCTLIFSY